MPLLAQDPDCICDHSGLGNVVDLALVRQGWI